MAKSNNLSGLFSGLSGSNSRARGAPVTNLVNQAGRSLKVSRDNEMKSQSFGGITNAKETVFGKPSSSGASSSTQTRGNEFSSLLKQKTSSGIVGALEGSLGFGGLSGIGSIISGIANLFGSGKKTPPPLVEFQLPNSQNQTLYTGAHTSMLVQGSATQSPNTTQPGSGIYNSTEMNQNSSDAQWLQDQNGQIAHAVKTALLHSSSLADVIAEI
ncbi:MAG: hypothetical protein M3Y57_15120 [Acidobacteriota bacterium]|nr:hypothetical protein [Acidobacteriota bacterium]